MKKYLVLIIIFTITGFANQGISMINKKTEVTLKGKLINYSGGEIAYLLDVSDKAGMRVPENITIVPDKNREFKVSFELSEPGYFKLEQNTIYLTPGDILDAIIDCNDRTKSTFKGKNAPLCDYLKTIPEFSQVDIGYLGRNYENVQKEISSFINEIMLPQVLQSRERLKKIKGACETFTELENARINSNIIMSIMLYTAGYTRKFVENFNIAKDTKIFNELREGHLSASKKILMEAGKNLANAQNIVLPEFRKILVWVTDTKGDLLPAYKSVERIDEFNIVSALIQKYASCFTGYPSQTKSEEVLNELIKTKEKINTQLYKRLIDKSLTEYSVLKKGGAAFDFTGMDIDGKSVKLSDYKGKYIYLDFWATWCGPCIKEYPYFQELNSKFKDKNNIVFISVSTDQDKDKWIEYMKKNNHDNISIHVLNSHLAPYKIAFIPRFILIDKDFNLLEPFASRPSQPETVKLLESLK